MEAGTWTGKMLGKYEIGPVIGQGGMAQVYKGHHPALKRDVAIKLIHSHLVSGEGFIERFQREAQLVAALRHPNIVQVYDLDTDAGVYFMVMEFIDGLTLSARLEKMRKQNQLFSLSQTVELLLPLCSALDYAHSQGMIHRDVKPGNVMFTGRDQPVLTDFGLAKIVGGTMSMASGLVVGTPMYMSPEQAYGESGDARSDIYALGVMLFELVTGNVPFTGDTPLSIIFKQVNDPLPSVKLINALVPDKIEQIIIKATAKKPANRYQSCAELAAALRAIHDSTEKQTEVLAKPPVQPPAPQPVIAQEVPTGKTVSLDGLRPILVRILGPVGRIMEVNRVANAMRENPATFPIKRLDELLDRIATQYRLTDPEKKAQIRQSVYELFGNSKE
jgi:serine/threonine protein kinase